MAAPYIKSPTGTVHRFQGKYGVQQLDKYREAKTASVGCGLIWAEGSREVKIATGKRCKNCFRKR